jgi:hypothetical protein
MTPKEILKLVQEGADARLGETVEKLLLILKYRHTHQCWRKECSCEYCRFINGEYVSEKLALHALKKKENILEQMYWTATDGEVARMYSLGFQILQQKTLIRRLKEHKKKLQGNIV